MAPALLVVGSGAALGAEGEAVDYAPPVDAPVVDPFRPPPRPWLPGNRGIEYSTEPGTVVRAAGRGTVAFAGRVAGSLHVTVSHPDGVRTSYSHLATVHVLAGQAVSGGDALGATGRRLHVGARRGATYIDPASLWSAGPPWVRLVPLDGHDGRGRVGRLAAASGGAERPLVVGRGVLPRLLRRSGRRGRAPPSPHSSVRQRSPSGVRTG